eukprot:Em0010g600a
MAMLRDAYFPKGMLSFLGKLEWGCQNSCSSSSSSESSDSDARKKKRKSMSKWHKRHHHSRSRRPFFASCWEAEGKGQMPSQRPWQLAGGLEHLYRHPGPDRPPHCTGAGEVPVNYLTAFSVYSVAATLKCSGKLQPETGPSLECTEGGLAGMVRHEPCILDQTAILHQLTNWDIRGTSTPRSHNWQLSPLAGSLAAVEITLPRPSPAPVLQWLRELQQAHTPLRCSAIERELKGHPDKAWVSWLLNGIDNSVSTGYDSPHFSLLHSTSAHLAWEQFQKKKGEVESYSSPICTRSIFNNFASALQWVLVNNYGASLLHYLDDFLLVDPPDQLTCQESMSTMLQAAGNFIPDDVMAWEMHSHQEGAPSLIGKLSFAAKVVPAGRLFLRHLIHLSTSVRWLHHHIHLNPEARADLRCWNSFLPSWNGILMFIVPEWKDAESFQLYTDASTSFGFGAYLDGAWFRGDWRPHQQLPKCSIQWQELFAIVSAARSWGHLQAGQYISHKQLYSLPGALSRQTELHCGCAFPQSNVPFLFPCPPDQPAALAYTSRAGRALEGRFKYLLHRAMAHSTSTTYRAGIRKYYAFCTKFNLDTPPRVQQSGSQQPNTEPSMQRSQGPTHLKPKRLPLTVEMLEQLLRLLDSDPLSRHDRLMLKAALTFGFFGFLREGIHFLIKKSKTDQTGRGTIISMSYTHRTSCPVMAQQADFGNCTAQPRVVLFHFHTLTSRAIRAILKDLLLRCGYDTSKYNTQSLRLGQQQQQHKQASHCPPSSGWEDGAVLPTPPIPGIH